MHLIVAILVSGVAVFLTAWFPQRFMQSLKTGWYDRIRPSLAPPNVVFPVVWTVLYCLIGAVLALALSSPYSARRQWLLLVFGANLALNVLWTYSFFGVRRPRAALLVVALIWLTIVTLIQQTMAVLPGITAYLLLPYLAWVSFAAILNTQAALNDHRHVSVD